MDEMIPDSIQPEQIQPEPPKVELTTISLYYINHLRKWTTFFAVLGFIFIGFILLFTLFAGTLFSRFMPEGDNSGGMMLTIIGIVYLVIGIIYFFPVLYLFRFSTYSKKGVLNRDATQMELAFKNLNAHYRYIGVMTIIMLSIYVLAGICFGIARMMMG